MAREVFRQTTVSMSTCVTIEVVADHGDPGDLTETRAAVARAFEWFRRVEACCTRFDPESEMMRLTTHVGVSVTVSPLLFQAVQFALAVAERSGGAFDPTLGRPMETLGFNREYRTGSTIETEIDPSRPVTYRDVAIDDERQAITLSRPMVLDLGAVAKGLAIDIAARELRPLRNYAIDAGGDVYVAGSNRHGTAWSVGIRHPRDHTQIIDSVRVSDAAVCTSGDYERRSSTGGHHIIDPRTGASSDAVASATVVAPTAMAADALATAAFVLGPAAGIALLEREGVQGLMISPALDRYSTREMSSVG